MFTDKRALRSHFLTLRVELSTSEKQEIDKGITDRILSSRQYLEAESIFIYVSTSAEIDTHVILMDALKAGKTVCVPLCGRAGEMTARRILSLDSLSPGKHGILEPQASSKIVSRPELAIVPALACDRKGYRLGYGGGYYDRFLARTHSVSIALCAESRLVECLPHDLYDQRCRWIATERRVFGADEEQ